MAKSPNPQALSAASSGLRPLLTTEEGDLTLPGVQVVYDPEEAAAAGAFEEDALSDEDAWDANGDAMIVGEGQ